MTDNSVDINARFNKIDEQLDRITSAIVKGFERIDTTLETKANVSDVQRTLEVLDALENDLKSPKTSDLSWRISLLNFMNGSN